MPLCVGVIETVPRFFFPGYLDRPFCGQFNCCFQILSEAEIILADLFIARCIADEKPRGRDIGDVCVSGNNSVVPGFDRDEAKPAT